MSQRAPSPPRAPEVPKSPPNPDPKPRGEIRRRRSSEEARAEILDAAQRLLQRAGPDAIRLQDIARDVGISHPTILHHFGSRDGLIQALDRRAVLTLTEDIAKRLTDSGDGSDTAVDLIERLAHAMDKEGLARLIAWWAMREPEADPGPIDPAVMIAEVAGMIRSRFVQSGEAEPSQMPTLEETIFSVRLAVMAMFGEAMFGHELSQVGADEQDGERRRFRAWLGDLLIAQVKGDGGQ